MIKLEELKNMAAALNEVRRVDEKKMDKVDKDALKGDFEDRKDKDIDNDGDVDASDQYLHNRRKAVSKAMKKEEAELDEASIEKLTRDRNTVSGPLADRRKEALRAKIKAARDAEEKKIKKSLGIKEAELDEGAPYKVDESTDLTENAWEEIPMMKRQLHYIKYAADEIMEYMNVTMDPEEWFQNKLAHVHDQMQSLHAYIEGDKRMMAMEATDLNEDITKMSHGRLKWHMNTGVPHGSYTNDEMKKERDRRLKNRDSADAYKKAKAGLSENFMEATDAEIRAKQTAGATKPEGIADKESEGSKKFMMMHTTQVPDEVNADEINRMNAEEIKASLQRKVSYRWNDQKIGDK